MIALRLKYSICEHFQKCREFPTNFQKSIFNLRLAHQLNKCMRISELEQPRTPDQMRIDSLTASSERAKNAVKQERQRQKIQKAQKTLQTLQSPPAIKPIKSV
jgi:hypothetical protein